ncbi:unnamed protein product [Microthlaspi erraticum]|uniref:Uncharacterized protein n=1 Tax=Microthlaspi erraticum TaxID=1685480 RepID=A0A6D2KUQ3_9BRAS|nr:unnamed protein product [Microthlaspi erraticum]
MVLMASLSSFSHALTLNGLLINVVQVTGVLRCSLNGNLNAPPLSRVTVHLACDGTDIAQTVTDQAGAVAITNTLPSGNNFDLQRCLVRVYLPVASCSVFPLNGVLTAPLSLVHVIPSTLGNVACLTIGFVRLG